jgi:hypothetical protein
MNRTISMIATTALLTGVGFRAVSAQVADIPESMRAKQLPRQHLSGPRFGFTSFTGDIAKYRSAMGKSPIMSQFGGQFETQIVSTTSGNQALMEWVALIGGVEQNELTFSLSWLAGFRTPHGMEFGVGPNVSVNKDSDKATTSMVVAAGTTVPFGEIYVPLNAAVAFAQSGPRITALIGWIIG